MLATRSAHNRGDAGAGASAQACACCTSVATLDRKKEPALVQLPLLKAALGSESYTRWSHCVNVTNMQLDCILLIHTIRVITQALLAGPSSSRLLLTASISSKSSF
eukprot:7229-Heterococcus_DN1.PRE.2